MLHRTLLGAALITAGAFAQSTLIPVATRRTHVFDASRSLLYITTSTGKVERYNVATQSLLAPFHVSATGLGGCDLTPDAKHLYVCDTVPTSTQGFIRKVDLDTGGVTTLSYNLEFFESGAFDLSIAGNGRAFFTTDFAGSGWTPLREILLATDTIQKRQDAPGSGGLGQVRQRTQIARSADRSLLFFTESNISSGPAFTYSSATNAFPTQKNFQTFWDSALSAVSRNGARIAAEFGAGAIILSPVLNTLTTLNALTGGLAFDPAQDRFLAVDPNTDQLRIFDSTTFQFLQQVPVGENVGASSALGAGEASMSADGAFFFLSTAAGVRMIAAGQPGPLVSSVTPTVFPHNAPTPLLVKGNFFNTGTGLQVKLGGVEATDVVVVDGQTIQCTSPALPAGFTNLSVSNSIGTGGSASQLTLTPAMSVAGSTKIGEAATFTLFVKPGEEVLMLFGLGPTPSIAVPPFDGELGLKLMRSLFHLPVWPLPSFQFNFTLPSDPWLVGQEFRMQALAGTDLTNGLGSFSNWAGYVITQ